LSNANAKDSSAPAYDGSLLVSASVLIDAVWYFKATNKPVRSVSSFQITKLEAACDIMC